MQCLFTWNSESIDPSVPRCPVFFFHSLRSGSVPPAGLPFSFCNTYDSRQIPRPCVSPPSFGQRRCGLKAHNGRVVSPRSLSVTGFRLAPPRTPDSTAPGHPLSPPCFHSEEGSPRASVRLPSSTSCVPGGAPSVKRVPSTSTVGRAFHGPYRRSPTDLLDVDVR